MTHMDINGLRTHYRVGGHGDRDLLFLHGWGSSGRMWLRSMFVLRQQYRVWALDLPGFGESEAPQPAWETIESFTDHVAAFCVAKNIQPYAVIGHSMGGRIALDLARRYPQLTERVVPIAPALTGRLSFNLDLFLAGRLGRMFLKLAKHVRPVAFAHAMAEFVAPRYVTSGAVRRITTDLMRTNWEAGLGSLRALIEHDFSPNLKDISQPTLLICGDRDLTIPSDDSRLAVSELPNANLLMLPRVSHVPTDEVEDVYLETLQRFLANGGRETEEASSTEVYG